MRTRRLTALCALLLAACGGEANDDHAMEPAGEQADEIGIGAAGPPVNIYNIEANDQYASETTLGDVFYARTVPKLAGQSFGWWARFDLALENTGGSSIDVTGFRLDTDVGGPVDQLLSAPVTVTAGQKKRFIVPGELFGTGDGPTTLNVGALVAGYGTPATRTVDFRVFEAATPSGGFRFPARAEDLNPGEYWLADDHSHSEDQTYAYDFNVARWTGSTWDIHEPGGDDDVPSDHLIWEKPLYAAADGYIVRCWRSVQDDIDGDSGGGNTIILDVGDGKYLSYWHMRQWSVSEEHCPHEGFGGPAGDDPAPLHIFVRAGTQIGKVGHTGASSAPHLHFQLSDTLPSGPDAARLRSLPINFHNIDTHRDQAGDDASNPATWTRIHASKPAALHTWNLVEPNPCGWLQYDLTASEITHHAISEACYQDVVDAVVEAGFRLVHVDGYDVGGATFFNAVWRPADGTAWAARHGLSAAQYQTEVDDMKDAGYQLLEADSYLSGGSVRYAAIFQAGLPLRAAYHGKTAGEHQALFDSWKQLGYHPVSVSVVSVGGARQYTAVWEKSAFPNWVLSSSIVASDLTATVASHASAGRNVWSLQAYRHGGALYFAGLFGASGPQTAVSGQNTSAQHQSAMEFYREAGWDTRLVTGFESGGQARFVGVWTN